ncbi:MAG: magnesium-translocating P-type ATPase [Erysipelotrichaceae bacterium]|nr:magnesium-translocating P-type ATPase [Erysipelotrichaceae bacterium]
MNQRINKYAHQSIDTLFHDFHINDEGYHQKKVEKSRKKYGSNEIIIQKNDKLRYRLKHAFVNPFSIILFILAIVSFITDVLLSSNYSRNMTTFIIITTMLILSGIIRYIQETQAKKVMDKLTHMIQTTVSVKRDGKWQELLSNEIVVGDYIRFYAGDNVPADIRITKANDLFVSQAMLTGESTIVEKNKETILIQNIHSFNQYSNIVFMGSTIIGGKGEGVVLAVGKDSVYGSINQNDYKEDNYFDQGAHAISLVLVRFMIVLVPIVFIACALTKENLLSAFLFALSVAVGLMPEMLPMVINACLAKGSSSMQQKETIVKNINAMQGFGSMDVLCVDKTGTLTQNQLTLEYYLDILGNESQKVLSYAYLNSYFHTGVNNHIDKAILKCQEMNNMKEYLHTLSSSYTKLDELPFDYERKFASLLIQNNHQTLLISKGSIDEICQHCTYIEYNHQQIPITDNIYINVHNIVDEMLEDGMKVIAIAYKPLEKQIIQKEDENDLILLGYIVFFDAPKQTASQAIEKLQQMHVNIRVLTGDQKNVTLSICQRLNIDTQHVLTGAQLDQLNSDNYLTTIENTHVFVELSPKQKEFVIQILKTNGHTVGYLGDGMNDLPSTLKADVGISVDSAVDAIRESADVILLRKDLNVLEEGIIEGRKAFSNMSKYIKITASSNFGNIFSIVLASIFLPFLPMTAIQLLLLNLLYDALCLILPWDHVDKELLNDPLEWGDRHLGQFMRFFGPISSLFDIITFLFLYFIFCPMICGGHYHAIDIQTQTYFISLFQTGWFLESMWSQILILHLLRTQKIPFIESKPSNPVIIVTTIGILFYTILTFTNVGHLLGLTAMPLSYFTFLIIIVILYLLTVTLSKSWYIHKYHELL